MTIATNVTDLYNFFESVENKPGLFIISDGGPDFSPKPLSILIQMYLNVFTNAAGYSAYNCIENLWAPS